MSVTQRYNLTVGFESLDHLHGQIQEHTRLAVGALSPQAMTDAAATFRALMMVRDCYRHTCV